VTTDHGFDEGQDTHLNAPYGFLASNDPRITRNGDRKDVAATILESFGISREAIGNAPPLNGYSLFSVPPLACIPAGQAYLEYPGAPVCCDGLQLIGLEERLGTTCLPPSGGTGDASGFCTDCGDGLCEGPENKCNCPADCTFEP
jgi:hypothetical protein